MWPSTAATDPYKAAVDGVAGRMNLRLGYPVFAAFNEFCIPTIGAAIDQALAGGAGKVIVVPTMLVRGNQHTELEIDGAVARARERHPAADIHYAWPFEEGVLVSLLAEVVMGCLPAS